MKYMVIVIVKPVNNEGGEQDNLIFKSGKQRCQNAFKSIVRMLEDDPRFIKKIKKEKKERRK